MPQVGHSLCRSGKLIEDANGLLCPSSSLRLRLTSQVGKSVLRLSNHVADVVILTQSPRPHLGQPPS